MTQNTPAFPACNEAIVNGTMGMDLRDYFAGQALRGLTTGISVSVVENGWFEQFGAKAAYRIADAMIEARTCKPEDSLVKRPEDV